MIIDQKMKQIVPEYKSNNSVYENLALIFLMDSICFFPRIMINGINTVAKGIGGLSNEHATS